MRRHRLSVFLGALVVAAGAELSLPSADAQSAVEASTFRALAREQAPTVVAIRTTRWLDTSDGDAALLERLFSQTFPQGVKARREVGSGILISALGEILTNDHVIADADVIEVELLGHDTTVYRATVVGRDPVSDSALLELVNAPPSLPVARLGDSSSVEAGDWVMAIGNPYQLGHSVSVGVVSYARRLFEVQEGRWHHLIQTDASINPGSSGGPLLNSRGEVVGLSFAVVTDALGDSMGIGFAVPINAVKAVLPQLRAGRVVRGSVGIHPRMTPLTDDDARTLGLPSPLGALIVSVDSASSGEDAGLRAGDVVVEFLGKPVETAEDLAARIASAAPGSRARIRVVRDGRPHTADVVVQSLTSPEVRGRQRPHRQPSGVGLTFVDTKGGGPVVREVEFGSPADIVGIEPGDVLRKVNAQAVRTAADLERALRRVVPGRTVFLIISRDGAERLFELRTY